MNLILEDITGSILQAIELLESIEPGLYTKTAPPVYFSGIGAHLRHNIDHYHCFLSGATSGRIDYDARNRDVRLERDRIVALELLRGAMADFSQLGAEALDQAVEVKVDCGRHAGWSRSTIRRELQFLLSHTVHHYAVIAMICHLNGHEPGAGFGVAPSTLKYRETLQSRACAR